MLAWKYLFMFCVFLPLLYEGVTGSDGDLDGEDAVTKSEDELSSAELEAATAAAAGAGRNQSESSEGPPDSHEAMNNRELKPKLTIGARRRKRSYEFLIGLVKRNSSLYPITKNDETSPSATTTTTATVTKADAKASELLLELLVKIAENPQQWTKVHELLEKLDKDLLKSKELVDSMKTSAEPVTNDVIKAAATTKHPSPWLLSTQGTPAPPPYQKNFAYHRVTGNPLTHRPAAASAAGAASNSKSPKAYIAVSVIAPKPYVDRTVDELALENELKELKPWSHQQNLKNMADIRSRWVIQNDKEPLYAP